MPELPDHPNVHTAVRYHEAVSRFAAGEELAAFFHPDAVHTQLPNALFPEGATRRLAEIVTAAERGRELLAEQRFDVLNAVVSDSQVALEVTWSGALAAPVDGIAAGQVLRAHVASFLTFRDGRITAQRTYDCYEPAPAATPPDQRTEEAGDAS
ncbi:nuclear transport factor 2 family protein [Streptomyces sp. GSL17-111]|uniref:nuclear transport factor 2 family protein n=1 Tax=Streptomyces sp. GSL17-111 TaxID=3121596 RepID=UPI0030F3BBD9